MSIYAMDPLKNREEMKPYMDAETEKILAYLEERAVLEGDVFVNLNPETEQTQMMRSENNEHCGFQGK